MSINHTIKFLLAISDSKPIELSTTIKITDTRSYQSSALNSFVYMLERNFNGSQNDYVLAVLADFETLKDKFNKMKIAYLISVVSKEPQTQAECYHVEK